MGDEGGFAPDLKDAEEVLSYLVRAMELTAIGRATDIKIAMDAASSELYDEDSGRYLFPGESRMAGHPVSRSAEEMVDYYAVWSNRSPSVPLRTASRRRTGRAGKC